ncbi:MAG: outer membrane lipoprotein carrier protein LolA [Proteobacteria bacterium]|nr:outer membrane lipoprotein carrier protein LolA [Pseudomonadota bacterium]
MIRRSLLALLLTGTALAAHAAFDIDQLMGELAQFKGGRARFVETRHVALLDAPVVSSGEMRFTPPDRLEKDTLKPRRETLVLEKNSLTVERDGRSLTWHVGSRPEAMAFIESVRSTLSGNRKALQKYYQLELRGGPRDWTLVLLPTSAEVQALVTRITISGSGREVRRIEYQQADGDRSELVLTPMAD